MQQNALPEAFLRQMATLLGDELDAFLAALAEKAPISLRLNAAKIGAEFVGTQPIPWAKDGYYLTDRPRFFLDPLIYAGGFYVQEASSMLVGNFLKGDAPLRILDLCAAPGGKSTLLASRMPQGSLLVSNEIVGSRAQILAENISRWGNSHCVVTRNHPRDYSGLTAFFDHILVDAPCSGEGMFRKDPDTISHWNPRMVQDCAARQREILTAISPALKPGGRLVYSTCTYNRTENEDIIQWLLDSDPGAYQLVDPGIPEAWGLTPGDTDGYHPDMHLTRHCYPHKVRGEGFFLAILQKVRPSSLDDSTTHSAPKKPKPKGKGRFKDEPVRQPRTVVLDKALRSEAESALSQPEEFELEVIGEDIHALPAAHAEAIRGLAQRLNLLFAGIRLGHTKGKTFIPSHDLAMSTAISHSFPSLDLNLEEALHYLKRAEFNPDTDKLSGWVLARYKGQYLGWMKVLENRVNNHFPKEMRIRGEIEWEKE